MLKKSRSLNSAISTKSVENVVEVLSQNYSFSEIVVSLAELLIKENEKSLVKSVSPAKFKISKEDFDTYFQIVEKRKYNKNKLAVPAVDIKVPAKKGSSK